MIDWSAMAQQERASILRKGVDQTEILLSRLFSSIEAEKLLATYQFVGRVQRTDDDLVDDKPSCSVRPRVKRDGDRFSFQSFHGDSLS